jgi:hypothetical protein
LHACLRFHNHMMEQHFQQWFKGAPWSLNLLQPSVSRQVGAPLGELLQSGPEQTFEP